MVDDSALQSALEDDDADIVAADVSDGEADSSSEDSSGSDDDDLFADNTAPSARAAAAAAAVATAPTLSGDAALPPKAPRKTVSAADLEFKAGHLTMLHVDIEHNGTHMVSISGETTEKQRDGSFAPRPNLGPNTSLQHGQYCAGRYFHMFVKPPEWSSWSTAATEVHGLSASSPEIKDARPLE